MQKKGLLALLLTAMMVLSGCTLIAVDEDVDFARVIVDVNGETIDKLTVTNMTNALIQEYDYYNQMYSSMGMTAGYPTDWDTVQAQVIEFYVQSLVAEQKIRELGLDQLTAEEEAQVQADADEQFQTLLDNVAQQFLANEGLEGDALYARAADIAKANNYGTRESILASVKDNLALDKLGAYAARDVQVTEEDLAAALADKAAAEKEAYAVSAYNFVSNTNKGNIVYYVPAGMRLVKQIVITFTEEDLAAINAAKTAQADAQDALTAAQNAQAAAGEGADLDALNAAVADAQAALDQADIALKAANNQAKQNIQAKTDEVYALVTAEDADFDALLAQYNEDVNAPAQGYAVGEGVTNYVSEFTAAAMALTEVGQVSQPVLTEYGYHILQYTGDLAEGAVPLDQVRDALEPEVRTTKEDEAYTAAMNQWISEAQVTTYPERMQ